ncbi:MAG: extracellular solute-binding protein [Clostridia bacterium]|nr:extracellular solute-binding protein [Clostridia bacterium]
MKKTLTLVLALVMMLSLALPAFADEGWVELRVEAYDRTIAGFNLEDCWQLRYAQEHFGDPNKIKLIFVPVPRWTEGEVLTTQLGGGTAPDLCMTYNGDLINQYIEFDGLYQLDALLEEYGPNLKAFLGDDLLKFGQQDRDGDGTKEQWFLSARRLSVANVGNFIRADWLKALNMEKPTDIESFTAYLKAAKEAGLGGTRTIPMHFDLYESNPLYNVVRFADAFIDFSQVTEEDWFAYSGLHEMLPGSKEAYRWFNQLYHEGLLYENFDINDDTATDSALLNGYFGFFSMQPDQPWRTDKNYQKEMETAVEGAEWVSVNCFKNESLGKYLHDEYAANGLSIIIPKNGGATTEEKAIAAVKYMDWLAQPENMFAMQNGVEGINYLEVTADGIPTKVQSADAVPDENKMHAGDICFISNGLYYGSPEKNAAAIALGFDEKYQANIVESYVHAGTDAWTQTSFSIPIQAETDYGAMIKSKQGEFLSKVVTCDPAEFDAIYDAAIQDILNTGASELIEEQRAAYQAGEFRGTFPGAAQ